MRARTQRPGHKERLKREQVRRTGQVDQELTQENENMKMQNTEKKSMGVSLKLNSHEEV